MRPELRANELLELVEQAIPVLEAAGDDRSLGRAWLFAGEIQGGFRCDNESWLAAAERALIYYERSSWPQATCINALAAALFHGPTPVEEAIARCRGLLRDRGPGLAGVTAMTSLGELEALLGRFREARELVAEARQRLEDLGQRVRAELVDGAQAGIELWAGNTEKAEVILRVSCERLLAIRAHAALATRAAQLAEALYREGRDEEAEEWAGVSKSHAGPDDIGAHFSWRSVHAKVLARRGDVQTAELLAREAVELAERTDALNQRAQALLDLAEVLRAGEQFIKARALVEEALELYERKGNLVGAAETRRLLGEVALA